ncbi:hypothetical protein FIBSPDRAFT_854049 [Athelia psychrophila]|uniref:Uncharacterized protein n=1 Tax=Athelia psychrophila TaxID=1759441 RepID=A0A166QJC0_9AGAM|nr:hypothetical protein FIBSPDRAFT_854049 [Fibularhizoctonia sp. CBS 109695]
MGRRGKMVTASSAHVVKLLNRELCWGDHSPNPATYRPQLPNSTNTYMACTLHV